jgi:hypothetical protein
MVLGIASGGPAGSPATAKRHPSYHSGVFGVKLITGKFKQLAHDRGPQDDLSQSGHKTPRLIFQADQRGPDARHPKSEE